MKTCDQRIILLTSIFESLKALSFDQWIVLIGQFFTLITVLLIYFQLRESKKQRQHTYKPEIYIPNNDIYIYYEKRGSLNFPLFWINKEIGDINSDVEPSSKLEYKVKFLNLGFGSAKNIKFTWSFDLPKYFEVIKHEVKKKNIPITVRNIPNPLNPNSDTNEVIFSDERNQFIRIGMDSVVVDHLDYIQPVSLSQIGQLVDLPPCFTLIISLLIFVQVYNSKFTPVIMGNSLPELKLSIKFQDIGNNSFNKNFIGKFISSTSNNNFNCFTLVFSESK